MVRTFIQAFTSPAAGPVGFALALILCGLLIATATSANQNEQALMRKISALTAETQKDGIALHARLAACEGGSADMERRRLINGNLTAEQKAQQLAGRAPEGFDVCARMESADRAVLETLR
jgi:hypothetical protein